MFQINLKNNKSFSCEKETTILNAAKNAGIILEHSCLAARCRSCMVKMVEGKSQDVQEDLVLSEKEKNQGYILSCNATPLSNIKLDIEDLGDISLSKPRTLPCKVNSLEKVTSDVIKVILRLPPNSDFNFVAGQYVNLINGNIKRSYSIANHVRKDGKIEFFIKNYKNGSMSQYWFEEAKEGDLLRLEGPLGTFFYRKSSFEEVVFLGTGTGIAPIKAILEQFELNPTLFANKKILLFWGGRYLKDIFWIPQSNCKNFQFIPVLSRPDHEWTGEIGYVQDVLVKQMKNFTRAQVYACGSNDMIESAKDLLMRYGLPENQFFSDAFVCSN